MNDGGTLTQLYEQVRRWSSDQRRDALRVAAADRLDLEARRQHGEDVDRESQGLLLWWATLEAAEKEKDGPVPPPTVCCVAGCGSRDLRITGSGAGGHRDMCLLHGVLWAHLLKGTIEIEEFDRLSVLPLDQWPKKLGGRG